jgi:hypothetical protein
MENDDIVIKGESNTINHQSIVINSNRGYPMKKAVMIFILSFLVVPLYGFNSLVRHEDIPKMKALGISPKVIQYFISNQTSSVSSEDVIKMKRSGMSRHYSNKSQRAPYPTTGATFPKPENYGYDPLNGRYYFFATPQNSQ